MVTEIVENHYFVDWLNVLLKKTDMYFCSCALTYGLKLILGTWLKKTDMIKLHIFLALQTASSFFNSFSQPFPPIALRRHYAQTVEYSSSSYKKKTMS